MRRPPSVMLTVLLSSGCGLFGGASSPSDHDDCRDHPEQYNRTRSGVVARSYGGISWDSHDPDARMRIVESRSDCLYTVSVEAGARRYELSRLLWAEHYTTSPGGDRLAFATKDAGGYHVVCDGVVSPGYEDLWGAPRFSRNGRHLVHVHREGGAYVVVVDGTERTRRGRIDYDHLEVLNDGRPIVIEMREDEGRAVIVGDSVGPRLDEIYTLRVSPGGGRYFYVGRRGVDTVVVIDNKEVGGVGVPAGHAIVFSPDERRFAYVAASIVAIPGGDHRPVPTEAVVIDGEVVPLEGATSGLRFLETGQVLVPANAVSSSEASRLVLIGARTPARAATEDEYEPPSPSQGVRMVLGGSVGPVLDAIDHDSVRVGADGAVRYAGTRAGVRAEVIDNVLVAPAAAAVVVDDEDPPAPPARPPAQVAE